MKISLVFLLLLASLACNAQSLLNKQVTLLRHTGTAGEFLSELDSLPSITLSYSSGVIDLSRKIQLSNEEKTVEDYLKIILKGQRVRYQEQNGKIFLLAEEPVKKSLPLAGISLMSKVVKD